MVFDHMWTLDKYSHEKEESVLSSLEQKFKRSRFSYFDFKIRWIHLTIVELD